MKILNKHDNSVIYENKNIDNIKDLVEEAVKNKINLSWANLAGANLSNANLPHADLFSANLLKANLSNANLYKANLTGVDLFGVDLSEAKLDTSCWPLWCGTAHSNIKADKKIAAQLLYHACIIAQQHTQIPESITKFISEYFHRYDEVEKLEEI